MSRCRRRSNVAREIALTIYVTESVRALRDVAETASVLLADGESISTSSVFRWSARDDGRLSARNRAARTPIGSANSCSMTPSPPTLERPASE